MSHPWVYMIFLVIVFSGALVSSRFGGDGNTTWYKTLYKPPFTPPAYVFGIVWPILYVLIAFSGARIFLSHGEHKTLCLVLWSLQLLVNFLFSWMFFGLQSPVLGFLNVIVLWILIGLLLLKVYPLDKAAFFALIPYIIWVSLALTISFSIMIHPFK